MLDTLELFLNEAIKRHIPQKQKRVKKLKQPNWMNESIVEAVKQRDFEHKRARKSNNPEDWAKFKRTKCYVTNLIRKSKRNFFQESIESNKRNLSKICKALKSLTKSKKQSRIIELSMEDGSTVTDMKEMANMFNEFFIN